MWEHTCQLRGAVKRLQGLEWNKKDGESMRFKREHVPGQITET